MGQYRNRKSSTSRTTTVSPVQPAVVSVVKSTPTRFKIQDSVHSQKSTRNAFTVEAEFQMYALGPRSSDGTDILRFWEVGDPYD